MYGNRPRNISLSDEFGFESQRGDMKKPFLVTVEIEIAVMAESEAEAIEWGGLQSAIADDLLTSKYRAFQDTLIHAKSLDSIPYGWSPNDLVWNADTDLSVTEAIKNRDRFKSIPVE